MAKELFVCMHAYACLRPNDRFRVTINIIAMVEPTFQGISDVIIGN